MRSKAGTGGKTTVNIDGKDVKTRAYKAVEAVRFTDEEMGWDLVQKHWDVMIVMQKSEGGKLGLS